MNIKKAVLAGAAGLIILILIIAGISGAGKGRNEPAGQVEEKMEKRPEIVLQDRVKADYEEWLGAAAMLALPAWEEEFTIKQVLLTGRHTEEQKDQSQGIYLIYESGGEARAIYCSPLEAERTEPGTVDLYENMLGFATYDQVDMETVDTEGYEAMTAEDLTDQMRQSLIVSLYEH